MKPEDWQQINGLFQAVVELEPSDRASFLDKECGGNSDLRLQLDSLLDIDSLDWEFFEKPAFESAAVLLAEEEPQLLPGRQVGHYKVVELIGKGGMGEVYLARDEKLNRRVALKLLPADCTQNEYRLRLFRREAQTASAFNHPNILTIYELGEFDGRQYIVSELVEGETLRERLSRGRLSVNEALDVGIQLAEALASAHSVKIVHCDIKPENIMLRHDGLVKLLDFGLSRLADPTEQNSGHDPDRQLEDSSPLLMGTPRYMSPEHFNGKPLDARSDIFSLGIVFYEALSGRSAFDDKDRIKLAESVLKNDPPALDEMVPEQLRSIVAKMLLKEKESRYQNADELLANLRSVKKELEIESKTRHPWIVAAAIALPFLLATGLVSFWFIWGVTASSQAELRGGSWTSKAQLSSPRTSAEPAVLNGVLYAVGGWNACTPSAELEAYDPASDTWTQRAPMLTARAIHGVAPLNGLLYAVGGSTDCGTWIASVEAYDEKTNTWSEKTSLPLARAGHVVAASNGELYAIGGKSSETDYLDLNTRYDSQTDTWVEMAPMPTARAGAAAAVVQGIIYVIGGSYKSRSLATVEAYDPMTNTWTARRPMPERRNGLAVSEISGIIYAFGGAGNHANVEAYDPAADSWTAVAESPTRFYSVHAAALKGSVFITGGYNGVDYLSGVLKFTPQGLPESDNVNCLTLQKSPKAPMTTARQGMAVGLIGGIAYVVGGYAGNWRFVRANEAYDPAADSWSVRAPMPAARETRAANSTVAGDRLFVIGGNAEGGKCTGLNQAYDPATDSWSTRAPMPTPRCHMALVEHEGLIYAIGGGNTSSTIRYSAVEVYDPTADSWSVAAPMPTVRQDARAVSLSGMIYMVGGWNPAISEDTLNVVEAFDPLSDSWTNKAPMKMARSGMTAGVLNGKLVVVGGLIGEQFLTTAEIYDPVLDRWSLLNSMATSRAYSSAVTINDTLYVFGGAQESSEPIAETETLTLSACRN